MLTDKFEKRKGVKSSSTKRINKVELKSMFKKIVVFLLVTIYLQVWQIMGALISYAGGNTFSDVPYDLSSKYTALDTAAKRNQVLGQMSAAHKEKIKFITYEANRIVQNEKLSPDYYYTINSDYTMEVFGNKVDENAKTYMKGAGLDDDKTYKGFRLSQNQPGQCGIIWRNALNYKGQDIDVKFTFSDWTYYGDQGGYDPAMVCASEEDGFGIFHANTYRIKNMKYDIEFFKTGTEQKATIKGVFSIYDVDSTESNAINLDQIEKLYIQIDPNVSSGSESQTTHLDAYYSSPNLFLASRTTGEKHFAQATEAPGQCLAKYHQYSFLIDTTQHSTISIQYEEYKMQSIPQNAPVFMELLNTKQYIPFEVNQKLTKTVTDNDEQNQTSNTLSSLDEEFTYNVSYEIPNETETYNFYKALRFEDQVDSRLNITSVKIYDQKNVERSGWFNISKDNNKIIAKTKDDIIKASGFYGKTYRLEVKVQYNGAPVSEGTSLTFSNKADVYVDEGNGDQDIPSTPVITTMPLGYVQIKKTNSVTNSPMSGIEFGVYSNEGCTNLLQRITTDGNGIAKSTSLNAGTYYVKEISTPANYVVNNQVYTVQVNQGQVGSVDVTNVPYGYIKITKKDSKTQQTVAGAQINVYRDQGCHDLVESLTTQQDGTAQTGLIAPNMTYYVKEIAAPANYALNDQVQPIYVNPGVVNEVTVENKPFGWVKVTKKDSKTLRTVAGAKINVYRDQGCQDLVASLTTKEDGTDQTVPIYPDTTYYVKEVQAPTNYALNDEVKQVYVKPGEVGEVEIQNKPFGWIRVKKQDTYTHEVLQGAKINIYKDVACEQLVASLDTASNGIAQTQPIYPEVTYYVKEVQAPANYTLNTEVKPIRVEPGEISDVLFENIPNTATIDVAKLDKTTGKIVTSRDTTFALYEWNAATNNWVSPQHIKEETINGRTSDDQAAILKEKSGGTKGTYTVTMYYNASNQGKFKVIEKRSPYGYTTSNWQAEVQITRNGEIFSFTEQVKNEQVRGQINFKKNDTDVNYNKYAENFAQGDASLEGAEYGLYARTNIVSPDDGKTLYNAGALVSKKTTDANGKITWDELYLGSYYIKEITPSKGYKIDVTEYNVNIDDYYNRTYYQAADQTTSRFVYPNVSSTDKYANTENRVVSNEKIKKQAFQLTKLALDDDSTMAEPLQGAGFKIYLIKDLSKVKDGTIKPDADGNYNAKDFLGYDFTEELTALDFSSDPNGVRIGELLTPANGIITSPELAYGQYIVMESKVPEGYAEIQPFIVNVQDDNRTPKDMVYPVDRNFTARIRIVKKDDTTNKVVLKPNASYRIWNEDKSEYVEQWIVYQGKEKVGTEENPYKTSAEGELLTPDVLDAGNYQLVEVKAPDGYVLAGHEKENQRENIKFKISTNVVYEVDPDLTKGNIIITVEQKNTPQVGTITVLKQGEFLSGGQQKEEGYQFDYTLRPIEGAKFAIYAKEDVLTQDNQLDENGERGKIYSADEFIREIPTNEEGKAVFEELPLGKYYIKETGAGEGFVLNEQIMDIELNYEGQEIAVTQTETNYTNERQKVEINIIKKDEEKGITLEGAEFGLYTKEDIHYIDDEQQEQTIPANTLVAKAVTGQDGKATINNEDIPLGKYYIKELKAPKGYSTNAKVIDIDCTYTTQEEAKVVVTTDFVDSITKLKIKVVDDETREDLNGTKVVVRDEQGNVIGSYEIDENGEILIEGLEPGKQYFIEEEKERTGYVKDLLFEDRSQDPNELPKGKRADGQVTFRIEDTQEVQKVTLSNLSKVGQIEIEKVGEVLVSTTRDENGNIVFNYEKQRIDTATFEIIVKEDIVHPDGVQGVILEAGTKIGEGSTENGILTITKIQEELIQEKPEVVQSLLNRGLPLGTYEIRETVTPEGFQQMQVVREIILEAHETKDEIEKGSITIENQRQSTNIGQVNPRISIEKTAERHAYQAGEEAVYTIVVTNTGNTKLTDVEIREILITGSFEATEGILLADDNTAIIEKLEIGEQKTLKYHYLIPEDAEGIIDNEVIVTAIPVKETTDEDGNVKEEPQDKITDKDDEEIVVGDMLIKTVEEEMYRAGDIVEYTLDITNPYDQPLEEARVLDEKVTLGCIISTSKEGVTVTQEGMIDIGTVEPGERITIVYKYKIPDDMKPGTIVNEATLMGNMEGKPIEPEKDTTTVDVKKSAIDIEKKAEKHSYRKGEEIKYTIKVTNTGETLLTDLIVKEELIQGKFLPKAGIEIVDDQTVKIDKLEVGKSITLTYIYTVEESRMWGEVIYNNVRVTGKGIVETSVDPVDPEDPDNPKVEEVEKDDDEEVIVEDRPQADTELGVYKTDIETGEPIQGVIFGLYAEEDIKLDDGTILIEKDALIERATTNESGYARFASDLPIGKYYILEIQEQKGYIKNEQKIHVDSNGILVTDREYPEKLKAQNKKTEVNIEKVEATEDLNNRLLIVGAKLQLLDEDKNIIYEWETGEKPYTIKGLETQKNYILHEVSPAKGYVTTADITFSINTDGKLNIADEYTLKDAEIPTVVMQDKITRVVIEVLDEETKEPVEGVVVQVVDKNTGEVVDEFVTDGKEHVIEKLPIGEYEIVEKDFPKDKGHVSFAPQNLTVEDTPETQRKVIEKDRTRVEIIYEDEITKELVPGGKLEIRDKNGEVVGVIDNTGVKWYKERIPIGEYTIVEVEVAEGYEPTKPIKFVVKDTAEVQRLIIDKVRLPFDMKVDKYASKVLVDGQKKTGVDYNNAGKVSKLDIVASKIGKQKIQVEYTIRVTNTGKVRGTVGKIIDKIPSGMTFDPKSNESYWKLENGTVTTTKLEKQELKPGEYTELKIILNWNPNSYNFGNKTNVAKIENAKNDFGFDETDLTNNSSSSDVLFSIKTGEEIVLAKQIFTVVALAVIVLGTAVMIEIRIIEKKKKTND